MLSDDRAALLVRVTSTQARSRALVELAGALVSTIRARRLLRAHGLPAATGESAPEVHILLAALRDDDIAIGAAWVLRFGPIATDEQFAAIVRTTRLGRRRRVGVAPALPLE
jgi:hypothetical protein